jgi:2-oxoglutarate ferredoxin oxidoreductase subunit beta
MTAHSNGTNGAGTNGNGVNGTGPSGTGSNGATAVTLSRKDFSSDQELRWCPGCGDYGIVTALQLMLPELGIAPHEMVFVSGIGCAARLPYYMNTYGVHSIHGRAPALATGVAMTRPDLSVWVIGGDGDMLSIGGNHLIHALRRNVNLTILMFNNQIYGLTKGQYSPTSAVGKVTKSTPFGSVDQPFNPLSVALGAEASFVARTHDTDRGHMQEVFRRAHEHRGAAFVEVYQNCNVFNDGAYDDLLRRDARADMLIPLEHGRPIRFGADGRHGVAQNEFAELVIGEVAELGEDALLVHDEHRPDPTLAFALSRLSNSPHEPTPIGVFRDVQRPVYEVEVQAQVDAEVERSGKGVLADLIHSGATWTVQ